MTGNNNDCEQIHREAYDDKYTMREINNVVIRCDVSKWHVLLMMAPT